MGVDAAWTSAELAHALCDALVAKGQLKEKPAFIRNDREEKIAGIFEAMGLDGAKMASFENPGPLEMMMRRGTNGESWLQQSLDALIAMLPEEVSGATKKMTMDDGAKAELEAAKEKSAARRDRAENEGGEKGGDRDGGDRRPPREDRGYGGDRPERGGERGGDRGGGERGGGGSRFDRDEPRGGGDKGGSRFERDDNKGGGGGRFDRDEEGGGKGGGGGRFDDREGGFGGGKGGDKGSRDNSSMQCYNCQGFGHTSRDCPEPPKPKGGGKGKRDRSAMVCNNCKESGHKSRDCPHPVDEAALAERLAARKAKDGGNSD